MEKIMENRVEMNKLGSFQQMEEGFCLQRRVNNDANDCDCVKKRLFSICVPVYNVEKYLPECIESVLHQTYENFELILVDDGSKDGSLKICREYESIDSRVKVFSKKNEGQLATRKFAFEKSCGDVIICLDSDDFLELGSLKKLNDYFSSFDCDCLYYNWIRVCDGEKYYDHENNKSIEKITEKNVLFKKIFFDSYYNSMCLKAFKRELIPNFDDASYFKVRYGEDLIQSVDILNRANTVLFVPDILYNYRVNLQSVSHNLRNRIYYPGNDARLFVYDFLNREKIFLPEDWAEYGRFCSTLFFGKFVEIFNLNLTIREKISLLKQERNSRYYKDFIINFKADGFIKNFFLGVFRNESFFLLCLLLRFLSCIKIYVCLFNRIRHVKR